MVLRPIPRTIQRKILRPLIAAAQRVFITVNGVDEYFTFQNTKTFPNDFDLSIDAVLPTTATTVTLFGQTASADHYIKVLSTGFASINVDTSVVTSTVLATKDNKQRRYGVRVVGDDFIFTEEGVAIDTVTDAVAAAKTLIINVIAQSNGADFFNRTLSDPILTDLTTASNSVSWQLNRALPATTEQSTDGTNLLMYVGAPKTELFTFNQSEQRWVNSQLWTFGGYSSTGSEGTFVFVLDGLGILEEGLTYSYSFVINDLNTGQYRARIGEASDTEVVTSNGVFAGDITASANTSVRFLTGSSQPNLGAKISDVSIKRFIPIA